MDLISSKPASWKFLLRMYSLEALGSVGGNLMMLGIFFYTHRQFGWGAQQNLLFSSVQGMVYVVGALAANPLSHRFDRQKVLRVIEIGLVAATVVAVYAPNRAILAGLVLVYVFGGAMQWPLVESLISIGADSDRLSRRISIYNVVWAGVGAVTMALCGILIARTEYGIFWAAAAVHGMMLALLLRVRPQAQHAHAHMDPEPELIPVREMAKRLSRISLPATYAVIYAIGAIMPTLAVIQSASPETRTALAGIWMIARWVCFVFLGATVWWHTRPRALLIAAIVLLGAFLGITLVSNLFIMIACQIALGLAMGLIYSASLYFGMVLSDGSTEQSAYHEALIGMGSIVGPGSGALAGMWLQSGDTRASVFAVGAVLWVSVLGACVVSVRIRGGGGDSASGVSV